jgi:hypothetical protein
MQFISFILDVDGRQLWGYKVGAYCGGSSIALLYVTIFTEHNAYSLLCMTDFDCHTLESMLLLEYIPNKKEIRPTDKASFHKINISPFDA